MSNYILASNGNTLVAVRYYDWSKLADLAEDDLVYRDHTETLRLHGPQYVKHRSHVGPKKPDQFYAGTVNPNCLEADIHRAGVFYLRTEHKYISKFIVPGIGEYRGHGPVSITESGYVEGQPDIMIPIGNGKYSGLCIELKRYANRPCRRGKLSSFQADIVNHHACVGYKTLVSCDFNEVTDVVDEYLGRLGLVDCNHCESKFLNAVPLNNS